MTIYAKIKNLKIIEASDNNFVHSWNSFLINFPQYSFNYQVPIIEYFKLLSNEPLDKSFVVKSNDEPLAICVLVFEQVGGRIQASWSNGGFLPIPLLHSELSKKQTSALEEFIFEEIKSRLLKHNAGRMFVCANSLSVGFDSIENQMLARFGALDISTNHHIKDLSMGEESMRSEIRHSYKSIINMGLKTYEFKVYDKHNYTSEVGLEHRLLHQKTSGRLTRPVSTFDKMYSWIENECGLMFEQRYNNQTAQMILVALGKGTAYGASAADDPDVKVPHPLTHSMNYFIFQEVARRGFKYYDLGPTTYRSTPFIMQTPKELKINHFKRGFGGRPYPHKNWVWFSEPADEVVYIEEQLYKYKEVNSLPI